MKALWEQVSNADQEEMLHIQKVYGYLDKEMKDNKENSKKGIT